MAIYSRSSIQNTNNWRLKIRKTNALLNLINNQPDIDKISLYVKVPNIEEYNLGKKRKVLIIFDNMIADMINNKKLNGVVTELFITGKKLNISVAFITQSYLKVPKEVRLNATHFLL